MSVYFMQYGPGGLVKIGVTTDLDKRQRALQKGDGPRLSLLRVIDGGFPEERWLHRHFSNLCVGGEWFRFDGAMLTVVPGQIFKVAEDRPIMKTGASLATPLERAVEIVGSQSSLARVIGVSRSRVNNWLRRGDMVPPQLAPAIEKATLGKVKRSELRPDFPWSA